MALGNELNTDPDLSAKCANQIQMASFPCSVRPGGGIAPRNAEGHGKGPWPEAWSNPGKMQEIYDRSQYVIENTGNALKNELKTNSKRSLFERKMRGLNTKSGGFKTSLDPATPRRAGDLVFLCAKHPGRVRFLVSLRYKLRHFRDGGNPLDQRWVPAFAGMTRFVALISRGGSQTSDPSERESSKKHKIAGTNSRSC